MKLMTKGRRNVNLSTAMVAVLLGQTAFAATEEETSQGIVTLEEITVTARKREESLQDTPLSVSAFTTVGLEKRGMTNLADLSAYTPNININNGLVTGGSTNAAVFVRGVGQRDFIFPTDPGVGIYVDGVYIARSFGGMLDLADVERIEVLRGPQGSLYGKNTIGGAINVTTTRPRGELEGRIKATTGSRNRIDVEGNINFPIAEDKLYGKIAAATKNQDGYDVRQTDGLDMGNTNLDAIRGGLNWLASDNVEVYLSVDATRVRQNGAPGTILETFDDPTGLYAIYNALAVPMWNAILGLPSDSLFDDRWVTDDPPSASNGTGPSEDNVDTWGATATVDWEISDNLMFKSITGYREMDAIIKVDMDYTPYPVVHTDEEQHQKQFSQEFQLSGTAVDGKLEWLLGGYYFNEQANDVNQTYMTSGLFDALEALPAALIPLAAGVTCPAAFPAPCAGGVGNPYNTLFDLDVHPTTSLDTDNWAAFLHLTYDLTSKLSLTLGGRYSYEKKVYFIDSYYPNSGRIANPPTTDKQTWSKFTPKVGLDYHVNDDVLLYASFSKGFKSGGWNPRPLDPLEFKPYGQENLTAYEMGVKSRLLDNRMTLNVAGFYSQYNDLQLSINSVNPANGSLLLTVANAGDVDIWGIEAEIVARPTPELNLNLGLGYLDNKYTYLADSVGYSKDNELPLSSKWMINAGAEYEIPLGDGMGSLTLRGDLNYRSKFFHNPQNTPEIAQDGYVLVNARLTWRDEGENWQVAVFGTNITDEKYITSAENVPSFGFRNAVYGRPAEWGLSVSRSF
ncbi:TonB-dependent receptor [Emcibacter nanhaiensis]|uniref:TonB-dependent receptor n=1 Tax=Emcibacter nanhaiensis TaxID=1505037 RepID=A0A501PJH5_9PROT|nr:TonB-dependent receptor [Emcibacter nanhaiensis]TPD60663.1 TonB-dependent receptor [Emcibacter nanhaiensis]